MTDTRIYLIEVHGVERPNGLRLVRATSRAQAVEHVLRTLISARVADTEDMAALIPTGLAVETAGDVSKGTGA